MAQIDGPVKFQITPDPTDVNLLVCRVDYSILWSAFDRRIRLPYSKLYQVIGVDTPADTGDPPEAGGNDIMAQHFFPDILPSGSSTVVKDTFEILRLTGNEDSPPIPNPDELMVRVNLAPALRPTERDSNIVKINLP